MKCMFFNYLIVSFLPPPIKIGKIFGNPCIYWEKLLNFAQFLKAPSYGAAVFSY